MGGQPWGWHRLEPSWAARLVADAQLPPGALVLDLGAGDGSLTAALVAHGARVIAVELHPERADLLRRRFGRNVVVVRTDVSNLRLPGRPYHVVSNPPFSATSAILRRLLQPGSRLVSAHLIVQHQVARRWASASAPAARRWTQSFHVMTGVAVPRSAFAPRPHVDTLVLVLRRRDGR